MARLLTPAKQAELEPIIVEKLIKATGKDAIKQVANELKVEQDFVRHIYNSRKIGQQRQQLEEEKKQKKDVPKNVADIVQISNPFSSVQAPIVDVTLLIPELKDNMTIKDPAIEISQEESESSEILKKGDGYHINEDIKLSVVLDYETGEYTYSKLADKYGISSSSVYRIIKELGNGGDNVSKKRKSTGKRNSGSSRSKSINNHQRRKTIKQLEQEYVKKASTTTTEERESGTNKTVEKSSSVADSKKNSMIVPRISEPVKTILSTSYELTEVKEYATRAGLCKDRHEMNVDMFIYDTFSEDEMFNYPQQYNKAIKFIEEKVPNKVLHLYCTGIQCALAAVVKACHDQKVTLSLFHYNAHNSTYMRQDMWRYSENFVDEAVASFADIMRKGPVYTFGDKINQEEFYTISVNQVKENSDGFISQAYVCCDTMDNAFKLYLDYIKDINKDRDRVKKAVFITKCKVDKGKFCWDVNLSKSFNFK